MKNFTEETKFLWRVFQYIYDRRPFEQATLAIIREKAWEVQDLVDGVARAKRVQ
jgi:hypothetical protein